MPPNEDDAVKLAVAVNDIKWIKDTMTETRDSVKELSEYIKHQDEKYAQQSDVEKLELRVRKVEQKLKWYGGAIAVIVGIGVMLFEYGKQWLSGGGHP